MPHHRKRRFIVVIFVLIIVGAAGWTQLRPLPMPVATVTLKTPTVTPTSVSLPWPAYGQAAVGTSGYGILATHGSQKPVATASLAKIITAMAVLRQYPLQPTESGPLITITRADVDSYNDYVAKDGSVVKVEIGEQISERQALEALLLPSANNMADTLTRWAFGSSSAYTTYANNYVQSMGLKSIKVADASGFSSDTVASAEDMTRLGETALLQPTFATIVAEPTATIPVHGLVRNYNALLGINSNIGIKTGNNDQDKGAFLFAQKVAVGDQSLTLVGAVMDGPDLQTVLADSSRLASAAAQAFSQATYIKAGQPVATYTLPDHGTVTATAAQDLTIITWNGIAMNVANSIKPLALPSPAGTTVGAITLSNKQTSAKASVTVQTQTAAAEPSWYWRLTHPF